MHFIFGIPLCKPVMMLNIALDGVRLENEKYPT